MPRRPISWLTSLSRIALALGLAAPIPLGAWAQTTVVVPNVFEGIEAPGFSPFPLGVAAPTQQRFQQVYAASEFGALSEPRHITQIAFRRDGAFSGPIASTHGNVTVTLSTTAAAPDALNATFDLNTGADATVVFAGILFLAGGAESPPLFDLSVALSTPFPYDPGAGNLLLEIATDGGTSLFQMDMVQQVDSVSRVLAPNATAASGVPSTIGLVTQFTFQDPVLQPVVFRGDPAPDTGGGTYQFFGAWPDASRAGEVAFEASVVGGAASSGIFLVDPVGVVSARALQGETAPGTGGETYSDGFSDPSLNDVQGVAFTASVTGGARGVFAVDAAGVGSARALTGQSAPGTGSGTYAGFGSVTTGTFPAINDAGDVAFYASVTGGNSTEGIFVVDAAGAGSARALQGQVAPDTGGGTFDDFGFPPTPAGLVGDSNPEINEAGDVVFFASVVGGTSTEGIFVADAAGAVSARVLAGQVAPGTGGGTFAGFGTFPFIDDAGMVSFSAELQGATPAVGLFTADGAGVVTERVLAGDTAPGTGGESFTELGRAQLDDAGRLSFIGLTNGPIFKGHFVSDPLGGLSAIALNGAIAPGAAGGVFDLVFLSQSAIGPAGHVVFPTAITGGSETGGIYLPEPSGALLLGFGVALLLGLARVRAARRR